MSSIARLFLGINKGIGSGGVSGESLDAGFKGQIDLDSWEWGLERRSSEATVGAKQVVKPEPSEFRFSKPMDRSSTLLLNSLKSGEPLLATLTLIEDSDLWFELSVHMVNVRVIRYSISGKDEVKGGRIDESWVLNYDKIHFEHTAPAGKSPKTVISNSLWRLPNASLAGPDAVKKVVDGFSSLKSAEKVEAVAQFRKKFPDEMKGQVAAEPKVSNSSAKVQEVVRAFQALSPSDKKKASNDMGL
jgi:type VI protein secretion system component Hcp